MNIQPYVGITDFTNFEQVTKMLEVFRRHKSSGSQRVLHVGVMMSFKTLNDIETKWSQAFPLKDTIADIFRSNDDDVYYCLHYADYEHDTKLTAWLEDLNTLDHLSMPFNSICLGQILVWSKVAFIRHANRSK
jgi:hypothetical protein